MPVPAVLSSPPWARAKKAKLTPTGPRLEPPPIEERIVWGPSGRVGVPWGSRKHESRELDEQVLAEVQTRGISYVRLFDASNDTMFEILERYPSKVGGGLLGLTFLLARLGERTIPYVRGVFEAQPFEALGHVQALRSAVIAPFAAEAWHKRKSVKTDGGRWLVRHPETAVLVLLPALGGKKGKARDCALAALALLEEEEPDAFASALEYYGDAGAGLWSEARGEPAATGEPDRAPPVPPFLDQVTPPELLEEGSLLPLEPLQNLCGILSLAPHPDPHPELAKIIPAFTPESIARFARTLFEAWQAAGTPREHGWIARAAAHLGDDALVAELAERAEEWASGGGYARAVWIVEALAARPTTTALAELDHVTRRARSWGIRHVAESRLRAIAAERGISREDLADALVPDLGIGKPWGDEGHVLVLDGETLWLVGGGERLDRPTDARSRVAFAALARETRTVLSRQRARLEAAMLDGRRWPAASFQTLVAHPLLGQLARRLVWMIDEGRGRGRAIRVAEDGTFADAEDSAVALEPSCMVHVAHPVELGADLARWATRMHDYELLEPFPQLSREVFAPDQVELSLEGALASRLAGVARRGWSAGEVEDGGRIHYLQRTVRGVTSTMMLDPGLVVGSWTMSEPQSISCTFAAPPAACPVLYSEVRRDLAALAKDAS